MPERSEFGEFRELEKGEFLKNILSGFFHQDCVKGKIPSCLKLKLIFPCLLYIRLPGCRILGDSTIEEIILFSKVSNYSRVHVYY